MKCLMLVLALTVLSGCNSYDKLTNSDSPEENPQQVSASNFHVVACCRDNVAGVMTYPSFLPAAHVQLCQQAESAYDHQINGQTYFPSRQGCGNPNLETFRGVETSKIGDEYYLPYFQNY